MGDSGVARQLPPSERYWSFLLESQRPKRPKAEVIPEGRPTPRDPRTVP
ncbi:hypothetical protein J2W15_001104 [Pseudarthrobacter sulfonivorans]|jgi:hypothetical protein|nr:hypothetical protein [Pseudarthrobacter sulfonivorans]